jgi:hypothetical protein
MTTLKLMLVAATLAVLPATAAHAHGREERGRREHAGRVYVAPRFQRAPAHVWVPGYWSHHGPRRLWITGRWAMPPQPNWVWVPARWVWNGYTWVWQDGNWASAAY